MKKVIGGIVLVAVAGGLFYSGSDEWFLGHSSDPS